MTPPKDDEQDGGEGDEGVDAVGVEQSAAADDEDAGKIFVVGDGAGEAGKIREGRIGGERESDQNAGDGDVVKDAAAHDGSGELGDHALIVGQVGIDSADTVDAAEQRDASEQHDEDRDDDGERLLGVYAAGIAEGGDAVGDGFNAGQCCAAAGEDFENEPERNGFRSSRELRRCDDRMRMTSADDRFEQTRRR